MSSKKETHPDYYPYDITYRGTNSQGNKYDNRTQPCGRGYHYSNQDGSYYYHNGNNSTYYNDGQGKATYTAPNGIKYDKSKPVEPSSTSVSGYQGAGKHLSGQNQCQMARSSTPEMTLEEFTRIGQHDGGNTSDGSSQGQGSSGYYTASEKAESTTSEMTLEELTRSRQHSSGNTRDQSTQNHDSSGYYTASEDDSSSSQDTRSRSDTLQQMYRYSDSGGCQIIHDPYTGEIRVRGRYF